jgi:hypothetical protein
LNNPTPLAAVLVDGAAQVDASTGLLTLVGSRTVDTGGVLSGAPDKSLASARIVSATNTQTQIVIELRNLHDLLDLLSIASGGTATLTVEGSVDNVNWVTIDSIAAALQNLKHYLNSTVGVTLALSPLAFRWVRITAGAAGVGNTTTLTVGVK